MYTVETQSPIKQDLMSNNSYRLYSDGDFEQGLSLFTVRAVVVKFWLRDGIRRKRKNALRNGRLNAARLRRDFAGFRFSPAAFSSARRQCFPRFLSLTAKARGPRGRWTETNSNVRTSALVCVHGLARPYPRCRADRRNAITYTIYVHATAKESRRGRFAWRRRIVRLPPITPPMDRAHAPFVPSVTAATSILNPFPSRLPEAFPVSSTMTLLSVILILGFIATHTHRSRTRRLAVQLFRPVHYHAIVCRPGCRGTNELKNDRNPRGGGVKNTRRPAPGPPYTPV